MSAVSSEFATHGKWRRRLVAGLVAILFLGAAFGGALWWGGLRLLDTIESRGKVEAQRHRADELDESADRLVQNGRPGDTEQALQHYSRSLEIREALNDFRSI
jgi:hypothetical protein